MQQLSEWTKTWEFYHYLIAAGIVVTVLALILYLIPALRIKMPAIALCSLGCLAAGLGIGMVTLVALGYQNPQKSNATAPTITDEPAGDVQMTKRKGGGMMKMSMGGMKGGGMKGAGMGGMMMGGGRGPNSKSQLAALVDKLDVLTNKPLAIELTPEKKAKVAELLQGLDQKEELSEEDAQKKLDELTDQLKEHKSTLEAAGYRWPGEGGGGRGGGNAPNPFKEEANSQHLKALQERLAKGKAK
jgi:hypothetical protein